jgi:hypothetical protein
MYMARCGAEPFVRRRCCTGVSSFHTIHGIVRARAQKLALDGFPRVQYNGRLMTIWCIEIPRVTRVRLWRGLRPSTTPRGKLRMRVMYNVDMPNVCLKHINDMQTHCPFEFSESRRQMPDSRIDHSPSRLPMVLQTHHFVVFHR